MKLYQNVGFLLSFLAVLAYNSPVALAEALPAPRAKACVMVEMSSGRVLYADNADARLPMASTTKIMTALVVLERASPEEIVTVDERASGVEGSSMYLEPGETLTVEELLCGLLLRSGNDAAVALAIHTAGSVQGFVAWMNERAARMGLVDTHFANPNGLPHDDHYTTARELARITREAMAHPLFCRIVATRRAVVPWDGHPWDRVLTNHNRILTLLEGGNGVKTGYTKKAGRCLVSGALQEGMQLIAVTLDCGDDFAASAALLQAGFDAYDPHPALIRGQALGSVRTDAGTMTASARRDVLVPVAQGETVSLSVFLPERIKGNVPADTPVGQATVLVEGKEILTEPLYLPQEVRIAGFFQNAWRVWRLWQGRGSV